MRKSIKTTLDGMRKPRSARLRAGGHLLSGNLIGAVAAFLAAIVAARALSIDEFAAFGVGLAINSIAIQFSDLSLGTIAVAEIAESPDSKAARRRLKSLIRHRLISAVGVTAAVVVAVLILPSLNPYRETVLIGALGGLPGSLVLFVTFVLQGYGSFRNAAKIQVVLGTARLVLVGGCAYIGLGPSAMMVGYAVLAPAIALLVGIPFLRRQLRLGSGEALVGPEGWGPKTTAVNHSRRRVFAAAGIVSALLINGDVFLLTTFGTPEEVGEYSAAWRFSAGLLLANTAIAGALLPFIMAAPKAWDEVQQLLRVGLLATAGWLVIVPVLYVVGPALLGSVGEAAQTPMLVLLIAFSLDTFYFVVYQIYVRVRRAGYLLALVSGELVIMIVVTLAIQSEGALAPALGQLVARVFVVGAICAPILLQRFSRLKWFDEQGRMKTV